MSTPRFFNTAGPVRPEKHYCVPSLSRIDLDLIQNLLAQEKYFILHAPRQTGKTSCLNALVSYLNKQGQYRACYINVEPGQAARDDVDRAFRSINSQLVSSALKSGDSFLDSIYLDLATKWGDREAFFHLLTRWSERNPLPLVLFIDEVDSLVGDSLIALLRSLRAGYNDRPHSFPSSVILCGLRDVRDYRLFSAVEKTVITGGSAFNIKAESLRLGDFDRQQVELLLGEHTTATGQIFTPEAIESIWNFTIGQPWLVNALAYQACFVNSQGKDRSRPISQELVLSSKDALILRRDTHLDQLADKLREDRVRRVVQPILLGETEVALHSDDLQYCIDLGLIRSTERGPAIANPLYQEIIPRELVCDAQELLKARFAPDWVRPDETLDIPRLLGQFQDFYGENGEAWAGRFAYQEAGPQLLLQAFLQRIINGKGRIEREYALGAGRTDLYLRWPHPAGVQKAVLEIKILHKSLQTTITQGLAQVFAYAQRCGCGEWSREKDTKNHPEIHLLIFSKDSSLPMQERVFCRQETFQDHPITVWGM
jgi:hypothetical protein